MTGDDGCFVVYLLLLLQPVADDRLHIAHPLRRSAA
eukprot:COSAG01_NODE_63562_length_279_cov_1.150000_1_plen_35_part_10